MRRRHQTLHRLIWLLLTPALIAVLWLAVDARQPVPTSPTLPAVESVETRS